MFREKVGLEGLRFRVGVYWEGGCDLAAASIAGDR